MILNNNYLKSILFGMTILISTSCSDSQETNDENQQEETTTEQPTGDASLSDEQKSIFTTVINGIADSSIVLYKTASEEIISKFSDYEDEDRYDGFVFTIEDEGVSLKNRIEMVNDTLSAIKIVASFPDHESMKKSFDEIRAMYEEQLGTDAKTRDREDEKSYFIKWQLNEEKLFLQTDDGDSNFLMYYTMY